MYEQTFFEAENALKTSFSRLVSNFLGNSRYNQKSKIFIEMREIVMKRENWGRGEILKIGRNNLISIAIFNFHHDFPHFEEKFDSRKKRQISALPSDFWPIFTIMYEQTIKGSKTR